MAEIFGDLLRKLRDAYFEKHKKTIAKGIADLVMLLSGNEGHLSADAKARAEAALDSLSTRYGYTATPRAIWWERWPRCATGRSGSVPQDLPRGVEGDQIDAGGRSRHSILGSMRWVIACVLGLTATAVAAPKMLKGPYLQDLAPTSITVMWELDAEMPAKLVVTGPGGERTIDVPAAHITEARINNLQPASRYRYKVDDRGRAGSVGGRLRDRAAAGQGRAVLVRGLRRLAQRRRAAPPRDRSGRRRKCRTSCSAPATWSTRASARISGSSSSTSRAGCCATTSTSRRSATTTARAGAAPPTPTARTSRCPRMAGTASATTRSPTRPRGSSCSTPTLYSFALTDQTSWIERELIAARQDPAIHHVFVVMHHPPFSISLHGGAVDLRERWTPLFEKYQVSAVFSGHDHVYERAERNGIRYFVSGGGGAPLYPRRQKSNPVDLEAVKKFERVLHYLRVNVNGNRIEVTAVRADGTIDRDPGVDRWAGARPRGGEGRRPTRAGSTGRDVRGGPATPAGAREPRADLVGDRGGRARPRCRGRGRALAPRVNGRGTV